jgi:membrane-associated phospholipid phosphatase
MTMVWVTGLVFVVAGVVMSARLYLDAHTPREVLAGSAIGFAVGLSSMVVLY